MRSSARCRVIALVFTLTLAGAANRLSPATTGIISPCLSSAVASGNNALFCPAGDATLAASGVAIVVTLRDATGSTIPGIPAHDVWLALCGTAACPCGAPGFLYADANTNSTGVTTISGGLAMSGFSGGGRVYAQGIQIGAPGDCSTPYCVAFTVRSTDVNCDRKVDLVDLSFLGKVVVSGVFDDRCDYNGDGSMNSLDVALFVPHYLHRCAN